MISKKSLRTRYLRLTQRFRTEFEDLGLIGSGGFAEVHKVRNLNDDKLYALKIIKIKTCPNQEETEETFYRCLS